MDKPRICEILGVEVGEEFGVRGSECCYRVNEHGIVEWLMKNIGGEWNILNGALPYQLINDPSLIIRKPKFTDEEMMVLRYAYEHGTHTVWRSELGYLYCAYPSNSRNLPYEWLPSIKNGETIDLEELFGGECDA